MTGYCQLWLTCKDKAEADKIAETLLEKRLVACAKQIATNSQFHWQGKLESEPEVLLLMESREDLFEKVEKEISKLHSYDTFVLTASTISKISKKTQKWLGDTLAK
jgi:periplasmic divalent cation tolerance protein